MSAQQTDLDTVDAPAVLPELMSVLRAILRQYSLDLYVCRPAQVVAYDPATQTATVNLGFLPVRIVGDQEVPQAPLIVNAVPVRWLVGMAGTAYHTVPLTPGDSGHVHFTDRCLQTWMQSGPAPVDPVNGRAHDAADCFFEPGLRPTAQAITPPTAVDGMVLEAPLVKIGATAAAPAGQLALAQSLHTYILGAIAAGIAAAATPADGGAAALTAVQGYLQANPFTAFATTKALAT